MELFKKYLALTKPGIIRGNVMTAAAGFLFASRKDIDIGLFLVTMAGIALVIASGCVINNYTDRAIDKKMARTKKRALVTHAIGNAQALFFAALLGLGGFWILVLFTNISTVVLGLIGLFDYVVLYAVGKRQSTFGTIIGSIAGAAPIAAGYTAVANNLNSWPMLNLFLIMVFWQMPHFYAIALYRLKDYRAAGLPVLPAVKGVRRTQLSMIGFVVGFTLIAQTLDYTGTVYKILMLFTGLWWLRLSILGLREKDEVRWARRMFGFSLVALLVFSAALSLNAWVP